MNFNLVRIVRQLITVILIGIIGNLLFTAYTSDEDIWQALTQFNPILFLIALILSLVPWLGHAARTVIWSRFLKHPVSFKNSLRIALAHDLGGAITPTVVGGTPIKLGLLVQKGVPGGKAGMIVLLQVLEDLIFLITSLPMSVYLAGGINNPVLVEVRHKITNNAIHFFWIIPLLAILLYLSRHLYKSNKEQIHSTVDKSNVLSKVRVKLKRGWGDFREAATLILNEGKVRFALTASLMYLEWTCRFTIPIVLVYALGINADPFQLFFLHWLIWLASLIIPTPGASGGAEATFYFLFLPVIPETLIGVLITGWRFASYYFMMLVGALILQAIRVVDE